METTARIGIDPGPDYAAIVRLDGSEVVHSATYPLDSFVAGDWAHAFKGFSLVAPLVHVPVIAIEGMQPYGARPDDDFVRTCYAVGRIFQALSVIGFAPSIWLRKDICRLLTGRRNATRAETKAEVVAYMGGECVVFGVACAKCGGRKAASKKCLACGASGYAKGCEPSSVGRRVHKHEWSALAVAIATRLYEREGLT